MVAMMPMMVMTVSSSMRVNPRRPTMGRCRFSLGEGFETT
jgi:hypothetical protein